MSMVLLPKKP
jgi:hypothetical protein